MITDHRNVTITGGYWKKKMDLNSRVTMNAVYDRFHESGRIDAFRCDWKEGMPNRPHIFWDSDVAKWMEGAAYILEREENRRAVWECLEKLPEEQKIILVLRDVNGLSYEEIAASMGLELGTVKSRIFRARKRLCAFLLEDGNIPEFSASGKMEGGEKQ